MQRVLGWLVAAVVATAAGVARAEPEDGLRWTAVERCGSLPALRAQVEVHLGRPLVAADALQADVIAIRTPAAGGVRAHLTIATRRGRAAREVQGSDCAAVVDALAFVLASAVIEDGAVPTAPSRPAPDAPDDAPVPVYQVREVAPPAPERFTAAVALDGWSDAGTLPTLQLGVGGSLAVSRGRYRGELGAATWGDGWAPLSEGGGVGVTLRSVSVRGCYAVRRLWLCGGALQGVMRGPMVIGVRNESPWTAIAFQTLWSRSVTGPLRIGASIEGLANVVRPQFESGSSAAPSKRKPIRAAEPDPNPDPAPVPNLNPNPVPIPNPIPNPNPNPIPNPVPIPDPVPDPIPDPDSSAKIDPLARELQLLRAARAGLRSGTTIDGLSILATYHREFPRGQLAEEAAALELDLLCAAGRADAVDRNRVRFLDRWPSSALRQRVEKACRAP